MNIHVALSLTAAANAVLAGRDIGPFWPDNNIFVFTKRFTFQDKSGALLAVDPLRWLESLKGNTQGVWLHNVRRNADDRMESAFANGGRRWILEAVKPSGSDLWEGTDSLGDRKAADHKIWNTAYTRIATGWQQPRLASRSNADISTDLAKILQNVAAFADDIGRNNFAHIYRDALAVLESASPEPSSSADDFPTLAQLKPDAARLYRAALGGWNFGGMGSWNDYSSEGETNLRYERLTQELFDRLCEALVAVANTTFKSN